MRRRRRRARRNPIKLLPTSKAGRWATAGLGAVVGGFALYKANENYSNAQASDADVATAKQIAVQGDAGARANASAMVAESTANAASFRRSALMFGAIGLLGVGTAAAALWSLK